MWALGNILDKRLFHTCPTKLSLANVIPDASDSLPAADLQMQTILGGCPRHIASELTKYLAASRELLVSAEPLYVSAAPDAGKFNHREFKLCPIFENA